MFIARKNPAELMDLISILILEFIKWLPFRCKNTFMLDSRSLMVIIYNVVLNVFEEINS